MYFMRYLDEDLAKAINASGQYGPQPFLCFWYESCEGRSHEAIAIDIANQVSQSDCAC